MENSLFRPEAVANRLNKSLGSTRINVPFSYRFAGIYSLLLLFMIVTFLIMGKTNEKITVRGFLDSDSGVVAVHAERNGLITSSTVEEGRYVKKHDVLFVISNEDQEKVNVLIQNIQQQLSNLKRESDLKKEYHQSLNKLHQKHYVSTVMLSDSETQLLELQNRIKSLDLELIKLRQSQYQLIRAPIDGFVTNTFYKVGQSVELAKPLLQIIPQEAKWTAQLYIPVREIGVLKKNKEIYIKYDAYPAQRFGHYKAIIKEINLTVLTDEKEDKPIKIGEPYYKFKAELEKNYVNVYGKEGKLSHGMTFSAVVTGQKRTIGQWILDPIYSYYGEKFL